MRVLKLAEFVLQLGCAGLGRGGNDESSGVERTLALGELLDGRPQVSGGESLVVLALDDCVAAVRFPSGQVNAVLGLSFDAVAAKLGFPQAPYTTAHRDEELLEAVPADV